MTYANFQAGGRRDVRAVLAAVLARARRRWRRSLREPFDRMLLALFVLLQFADIASTNHALAFPGNREINPLMASLQAHLGAAWWLPKAAAVALVCLIMPLTGRRWPMLLVVGFCLLVVAGNLVAR